MKILKIDRFWGYDGTHMVDLKEIVCHTEGPIKYFIQFFLMDSSDAHC